MPFTEVKETWEALLGASLHLAEAVKLGDAVNIQRLEEDLGSAAIAYAHARDKLLENLRMMQGPKEDKH